MKFFKFWMPVFFWMGFIFYFSSRERVHVSQEEILNFIFFKTLHVLEYFFLYILSFRAFLGYFPAKRTEAFSLAFIITIFYAVTDEIHQLFVPSREGRPRDVIIDAIGATAAWIFLRNLLQKMPRKLQRLAGHWGLISSVTYKERRH